MPEPEPEDRRAGFARRDEDLTIAEHFDRFDREGFAITKAGILEALDVTKSSVEVLAGAIDKIATKEEVEHVRLMGSKKARRIWFALAAVALALAAGLFVLAELRSIARQNRANGEVLVECTAPAVEPGDPHECYEEGQARAAGFRVILESIDARLGAIEAQHQEDR